MESKRMLDSSKFEVGDKVRVLNKSWFGGSYSGLKVGDVYEVVEVISGHRYNWSYMLSSDKLQFNQKAGENSLELINKGA